VLAQLARGRMRAKRSVLEEAFTGHFSDHHGFLLAKMLGRVDGLDADIAELDHKLEELIIPFTAAADRLDEITGVGPTAACAIIAEVGVDMGRFPTPAHLASWARFAPGVKQSAGKTKAKSSTGHGNPYLARVLGRPPRPPAGPTPSWASATGASPAAAAPSGPSWRSAAPS
jgi:transposase